MVNGRKNVQCALCNLLLPGRGGRGRQPVISNVICDSCAEKHRKKCGLCGNEFAPTALRGSRFSYCLSCARSYMKSYKNSGKTISSSLPERECLWCLKSFMPPSVRSKCCSHACNGSHNMYMRHSGELYRASKLMVCECGRLISHQSRHCPTCRNAQCSINGCDEIVRSNGLCNAHYVRSLRGMDMNKPRGWKPPRRKADCSVDGCDRAMNGDDLCLFHLKRRDRGIPLDAPKDYRRPRPAKLCSRPGCDRKHHGQGLCSFHYSRFINGQDLDAPPGNQKRYTNEICLMDGCDKPHANKGYGLCSTHYNAKTRRRYKNGIHWLPLGERDNWICHLCGGIVEQIPGTDAMPDGGNVDHLIPRSKGGPDEWGNVRLAHYRCNHARSDRDLELLNVES